MGKPARRQAGKPPKNQINMGNLLRYINHSFRLSGRTGIVLKIEVAVNDLKCPITSDNVSLPVTLTIR